MKKNSTKLIFRFLILIIGFVLGFVYNNFHSHCDRELLNHINPDLICNDSKIVNKNSYAKLKRKLEGFIDLKKQEKVVTDVSIYFRDLQNGPTLGINEHALFSPASLLKLPLLLTFYNLENEGDSNLMESKVTIQEIQKEYVQIVAPKEYAKVGETYTVNQLLDFMIKYSDNNSYYNLLSYLNQNYPNKDLLKETFVDLGIIDPRDALDNTISVKSYGSIFVQLYNSSYFNKKEISEKALGLLSEVNYKEGLNAGVPISVDIAHKFGERSNLAGGLDQLHDCGIIYYPGNPYLLCVMTRGQDFNKLPGIIKSISSMVYEEFNSRKL